VKKDESKLATAVEMIRTLRPGTSLPSAVYEAGAGPREALSPSEAKVYEAALEFVAKHLKA